MNTQEARLNPSDITEETLEQIEERIGSGHSAWDCVDVRDIVCGIVNHFLEHGEEVRS